MTDVQGAGLGGATTGKISVMNSVGSGFSRDERHGYVTCC